MKKFYGIVVALFAVFAFGALLAGSASAETTLGAEWLAGSTGKALTKNELSTTTGSLLLEDTGSGGAAVVCKGLLDGTVGPEGKDEITEVLNSKSEKVGNELSGTPLLGTGSKGPDCETEKICAEGTEASPIEVWTVGLTAATPWKTRLFTMENGEILDLVEKSGYELKCLVAGIAITDTCTAVDTNLKVLNNAEGDAETPGGSRAEPLANCTIGGTEKGVNETVGSSKITLNNGELLSVNAL